MRIENSIKRAKRTYGFLIVCLCMTLSVFAQQPSVEGIVIDATGEGIPGVSVVLKGTSQGTITDINGHYMITKEFSDKAILVFSFIGMLTQEVPIESRKEVNVTLKENVFGLDEVVIVGYGTQEKKDITGSVALVGAEELESRPNTQLGSLIQGRAAGVRVASSSGKPSQ